MRSSISSYWKLSYRATFKNVRHGMNINIGVLSNTASLKQPSGAADQSAQQFDGTHQPWGLLAAEPEDLTGKQLRGCSPAGLHGTQTKVFWRHAIQGNVCLTEFRT
jgi:hypothetical protein